jgi:hypothetical protein
VIRTLLVTILIEGIVVLAYARLKQIPAGNLLRASLIVNLITQSILWIALGIFFRQYLIVLFTGEALIWLAESLLMQRLSGNQLTRKQSVVLSLCMNLSSFGVGWFLPI